MNWIGPIYSNSLSRNPIPKYTNPYIIRLVITSQHYDLIIW